MATLLWSQPLCPATKHLPILDHQFGARKRVGIDGTYSHTSSFRWMLKFIHCAACSWVRRFIPCLATRRASTNATHYFHSWPWLGAATTIDKRRHYQADELLYSKHCIYNLFLPISWEHIWSNCLCREFALIMFIVPLDIAQSKRAESTGINRSWSLDCCLFAQNLSIEFRRERFVLRLNLHWQLTDPCEEICTMISPT